MEIVKVHVPGTTDTRGYDLKFTREDADKYIANHPGATIIDDSPAETSEEAVEEPAAPEKPKGKGK